MTAKGYGFLLGVMFWNLIVVMVAQSCKYNTNHQIGHFISVSFMVCKLYLNFFFNWEKLKKDQ